MKLRICAMTALATVAMAGSGVMTSQAAVKVYTVNGNSLGSWNSNCQTMTLDELNDLISKYPGITIPDLGGTNVKPPIIEIPEIEQPEEPETEVPTDNSYASQVVNLINAERAKAGLPAVKVNKSVEAAANVRAKEIEKSFSHTRPNGSSFGTAIKEQGVNYRGSGENIAYGQKTPQEVMQGWMNSAGHRANILNKDFTNVGVGYYKNASGVIYWTQLFTY